MNEMNVVALLTEHMVYCRHPASPYRGPNNADVIATGASARIVFDSPFAREWHHPCFSGDGPKRS